MSCACSIRYFTAFMSAPESAITWIDFLRHEVVISVTVHGYVCPSGWHRYIQRRHFREWIEIGSSPHISKSRQLFTALINASSVLAAKTFAKSKQNPAELTTYQAPCEALSETQDSSLDSRVSHKAWSLHLHCATFSKHCQLLSHRQPWYNEWASLILFITEKRESMKVVSMPKLNGLSLFSGIQPEFSPVSCSEWRETKKGKTIPIISGRIFRGLSESLDRVGLSVKTYLEYSVSRLTQFAPIWSVKATKLGETVQWTV